MIGEVLKAPADRAVKDRARDVVRDLMSRFPAYPDEGR
jgi:hypothetical protein